MFVHVAFSDPLGNNKFTNQYKAKTVAFLGVSENRKRCVSIIVRGVMICSRFDTINMYLTFK